MTKEFRSQFKDNTPEHIMHDYSALLLVIRHMEKAIDVGYIPNSIFNSIDEYNDFTSIDKLKRFKASKLNIEESYIKK